MTYGEWYSEQSKERQLLSDKIMDASCKLGNANREGDRELAARISKDIQVLYAQADAMDAKNN